MDSNIIRGLLRGVDFEIDRRRRLAFRVSHGILEFRSRLQRVLLGDSSVHFYRSNPVTEYFLYCNR